MEKSKIYISGNTGGALDHLTRIKIESATRELRSRGYIVRNAIEICTDIDPEDKAGQMKRRAAEITVCDKLLMLDDWYMSTEANVEYTICKLLQIPSEIFENFINRLNLKPIE
ncbi:MAG: DUF4406 domain-containing protein [Sphingobacteriaceae bacterium]|nr:DUF4406 domain-containing protein [Sphingobacteriaceae bacterium]